jgi:hypothetical protein
VILFRGLRNSPHHWHNHHHLTQCFSTVKLLTFSCSSQLQADQWNQLETLFNQRRTIEGTILKHLQTVERAALNLSQELGAMYEGRLEEIAELNTTGKLPEAVARQVCSL